MAQFAPDFEAIKYAKAAALSGSVLCSSGDSTNAVCIAVTASAIVQVDANDNGIPEDISISEPPKSLITLSFNRNSNFTPRL
jgi:hypothetical protein